MNTRTEKNKEIQKELEIEKKRNHIKKIVKLFILFTIILIGLFFGFYFYSKYYSTKGLIVKEERLKNSKIPKSFNGIKLIQFSDLYYGQLVTIKDVENLINTINLRKPDIVVFTGNLIDPNYKISTKEQEQLIKELQKLNTTIGKYAISGKDDNKILTTVLSQSSFSILNNSYDLVYNNDNNPILIIGLSSLIKKQRNIEEAYRYFKEENHNSQIYTITLMSETDDLDTILHNYKTDLVLAGNSLNGQIKIPPFNGLITREGSKKYKNAYYNVNNTNIYISSGIGSPDIGFRLFVRPSINFFRLTANG